MAIRKRRSLHPSRSLRLFPARLCCGAVALHLLAASPASAILKTWAPVPPFGNSWDFGINWSPDGVPDADDDVVMDAGLSFANVTILESDTDLIDNFTLTGGRLSTNGFQLIVSDTNNSGLATIEAGADLLLSTDDVKAADLDRLDVFGTVSMTGGTHGTELEVDTTLTIKGGGLVTGWGTIDGNIVNDGTIFNDETGAGPDFFILTIDGDVTNNGLIQSGSNGRIVFNGLLSGVGTGISANEVHFGSAGGFEGAGTISSKISGDAGATITPTGNLTLGDLSSGAGFAYGGTLNVGGHTVTLRDSDQALLGALTTLDGGEVAHGLSNGAISLGPGEQITGNGAIDAALATNATSTITASGGDLTMGLATFSSGVVLGGTLNVGVNTVTLRDSTQATLGVSTTLGDGFSGGVLEADNGVRLSAGDTLSGIGTVDASFQTDAGSTVTVSSILFGTSLILGDASSVNGVNIAGDLDVGQLTAQLLDSTQAQLGAMTTLAGGTIVAANGVRLTNSDELRGFGAVNGPVETLAGSTISAEGGALLLGDAASASGVVLAGQLFVGGLTEDVTLRDSNLATLGSVTELSGGSLIAANGVRNPAGSQLQGIGTVDADLMNDGSIVGGNGQLTFAGAVTGGGEGISGDRIHFSATGSFTGAGSIDAEVSLATASTITATGALQLGANSSTGVALGGTLEVGAHTVTLVDSTAASLGASTTLAGGTLNAANGVSIGAGETISGTGTINADISGRATITAGAGTLTLNGDHTFSGVSFITGTTSASLIRFNGDIDVDDNTTIAIDVLDWDGGAGAPTLNAVTTIAPGKKLSLLVEQLEVGDPSVDGFDDTVTIDGGTLEVQTPDPWLMRGFMNLDTASGIPRVEGADLEARAGFFAGSGRINVTGGGTAVIDAPLTLADSASLDIAAGASLVLLQNATFDEPTITGQGTLTTTSGRTLRMRGDTSMASTDLDNRGTLIIGDSPGQLTVDDFDQDPTGVLEIEIGGTSQNDYDRLAGDVVTIDGGQLDVSLISGFTPTAGDSFQVIQASGGLTGPGFDDELLPALPTGLDWVVNYNASDLVLEVVLNAIPGDFDGDGDVDVDDFGVFVNSFQNSPQGGPPFAPGDFDEDGDVDVDDFGVFVNSFQNFPPAPGVTVPEPTTVAALFAALALTAGVRPTRSCR